jgi:hypothetical protein
VILNSVDAGASEVIVDLSAVESDHTVAISDNGTGMTLDELQRSFMSLGGSSKFGAKDKFGRIGIGSLALMHYAQRVEIETSRKGSRSLTRAVITHPWALDHKQRAQELGEFRAGEAWEISDGAALSDHFTTIRLSGVDELLVAECVDISSYYQLIERLRRILPLSWPDDTEIAQQLTDTAPELTALLRTHTEEFRAGVTLRSRWSREEPLSTRIYGTGVAQDERWNGQPRPILRDIVVDDGATSRVVTVAGYLLSQVRPSPGWSGITARVQNVAVEERTFFDLESDPGFRKYISGEVWILGEVDRSRLINIDRASFNRESIDYRAVARFMQSELVRFKADCVQAPQRAKVAVKRRLDQQVALCSTAQTLAGAVTRALTEEDTDTVRLPSSNNGRMRSTKPRGLLEDLGQLGAIVAVHQNIRGSSKRPYSLRIADDGRRVVAEVTEDLIHPTVALAGASYALRLIEARITDPPVIVRNRPREIVLNLAHDVFRRQVDQSAIETVLALEFAYLTAVPRSDEDLYDRVLSLISSRNQP